MGIDDIIHDEPAYAAAYEDALARRRHDERLRQRTDEGSVRVAATDGGAQAAERGTSLSLGSAEVNFSDTETLMLGLLLVNTAMTAGVLIAVLGSN